MIRIYDIPNDTFESDEEAESSSEEEESSEEEGSDEDGDEHEDKADEKSKGNVTLIYMCILLYVRQIGSYPFYTQQINPTWLIPTCVHSEVYSLEAVNIYFKQEFQL